jgi:hypothetical protein
MQRTWRPTDCGSKPTPDPAVLDAGTERAAVSLTLTAALLRHPWAVGVMESRSPGPANLR